MVFCPLCGSPPQKRNGRIFVEKMTKYGLKKVSYQKYLCQNGHNFDVNPSSSQFANSFIEHVVIIYLRSLSLNTTVDLIRIYFEKDILTKQTVLVFVEKVADCLPTIDDIDGLYHPARSGYLAMDGVWFKYRGRNFVLLIIFDPETFDLVSYGVFDKECYTSYQNLIDKTKLKLRDTVIKGLYCDGDRGLIKALKLNFPHTPIQVCVVHKEFRLGQILPFKRAYTGKTLDKVFRQKVVFFKEKAEAIIYAKTKKEAEENLEKLQDFMKNEKEEKLKKAYGSLKYNFKYILTHFDYPDMERDNNIIEGFNSIIKRRLKLLKGFKKPVNIGRYIKLILLDYRFHELVESGDKERRGKTPLELAGVILPEYYNFIKFLRESLSLNFES